MSNRSAAKQLEYKYIYIHIIMQTSTIKNNEKGPDIKRPAFARYNVGYWHKVIMKCTNCYYIR